MGYEYNIDGSVVKKPHQDRRLTKKEREEWKRCAKDPFYFIQRYCWIVGNKGKTLCKLRSYQRKMLEDIMDGRFTICNSPRQSGKSTVLTLLALWTVTFKKEVIAGLTSHTEDNCKDLLTRIKFSYENLPDFLKPAVTLYNQKEIRFVHNSKVFVQVTTNRTFRGHSFTDGSIAIFDEFAHVDIETATAAYEAAMPALEGGGSEATSRAIIISTPNGLGENLYARLALSAMTGENGWKYHKVDPDEIPYRDEAWRKKTIKSYGMAKFRQEFLGEFISSKPMLIASMVVESLKTLDPIKENEDWRLYIDNLTGRDIAVGVDVSDGVGLDSSTIQVFDVNTLEQIAEYENNTKTQMEFTRDIIKILKFCRSQGCGDIYLGIEKNNVGYGVLRLIENCEDNVLDDVIHISDVDEFGITKMRPGLTTTVKSKANACALFKEMVESHKMKLNSLNLLNQIRLFIKQGNTFKAERGAHDDLVSACLVVCMMLPQIANYSDTLHDNVNNLEEDGKSDTFGIMF